MNRLMLARTASLCLALAACAHSKIPNTSIDDTDANREILARVFEYQKAMEALDADAVISMVSPRYFEDLGNTDKSDDYDYEQLKTDLKAEFDRTKKIQLELRVDDIQVEDEKAYAFVYYTYRAHTEYPSGLKWKTDSDRTRFVFERDNGRWLLLRGL